jgi:cobalt/nickel transport protein
MKSPTLTRKNRVFIVVGLGIALGIGTLMSPLASKSPDGLERVAEDLKFSDRATPVPPAQKLPFYKVFDEYALRGVPAAMATPLAGLVGTLVTFGLTWGAGKVLVRPQASANSNQTD